MTLRIDLPDLAATQQLGARIASLLRLQDVVALEGELGAGKTELARAILRRASGDPALVVPSPTFTLVELYETPLGTIWHFDLYRLTAPEEAWELGLEEALAEGIALIEWPQNLGALLPPARLDVHLETGEEEDGRIALLGMHGGWHQRCGELAA